MNENQRTVTLPTIPKEVADAIESCREQGVSNATILEYGANLYHTTDRRAVLRLIPFDTLLSALVNGYVVEKSAEELAHELIRGKFSRMYHTSGFHAEGFSKGIRFTLNTLGIKIEGVNA